jgi:hypothetical protein
MRFRDLTARVFVDKQGKGRYKTVRIQAADKTSGKVFAIQCDAKQARASGISSYVNSTDGGLEF